MAHAAQLDDDGVVVRVIVVSNEYEPHVEDWCVQRYGGVWKQTSYNAKIRKNYAGIGFTYDSHLDAFIPPQPYPSWLLNEASCQWEAPTPCPADGKPHYWDEQQVAWVEIVP